MYMTLCMYMYIHVHENGAQRSFFLCCETCCVGDGTGRESASGVGEGKEGEGGGRGVSAFDFISREPPELPNDQEELSVSVLNSRDPPPADTEEKTDSHSPEHADSSSLTALEAPSLPTNPSPTTTSSALAVANLRRSTACDSTSQHVVRNSSGSLSPVPGPTSPPLTSHPSTSQSRAGATARMPVGKQQPSASKKKKKKVVR